MNGPQLNKLQRIDQVWMVVSVDDDGSEGVCATMAPNGMWLPLVAADEDRLRFIVEQARIIAASQQRLVRIIKLHSREEVESIDGRQ